MVVLEARPDVCHFSRQTFLKMYYVHIFLSFGVLSTSSSLGEEEEASAILDECDLSSQSASIQSCSLNHRWHKLPKVSRETHRPDCQHLHHLQAIASGYFP